MRSRCSGNISLLQRCRSEPERARLAPSGEHRPFRWVIQKTCIGTSSLHTYSRAAAIIERKRAMAALVKFLSECSDRHTRDRINLSFPEHMQLDRAECAQPAAYGKDEYGTTAEQSFACPLPGKCGAGPWTVSSEQEESPSATFYSPNTDEAARRSLLLPLTYRGFSARREIRQLACGCTHRELRTIAPRQDALADWRFRHLAGIRRTSSPRSDTSRRSSVFSAGSLPRRELLQRVELLGKPRQPHERYGKFLFLRHNHSALVLSCNLITIA